MKSLCKILILSAFLFSPTMSCLHQPDNNDLIKQIYTADEEVRKKVKEIRDLRAQAYQAEKNKQFEYAHKLKEDANKLEVGLNKNAQGRLQDLLNKYAENSVSQPWWQNVGLEIGSSYIRFGGNLDLDDTTGLVVKAHWIKPEFRRFHLGSYLYYPLEVKEDYPLHKVYASPLILEYRRFETITESSGREEDVVVNSYRLGFGVLSQVWSESNTYLNVNLSAGVEQYRGTVPDDKGPVVAYTLGFAQKLTDFFILGMEISESATWTEANQAKTKLMLNSSAAVMLRVAF